MRNIEIRVAYEWTDLLDIHRLLLDMHAESGLAALDPDKTMVEIAALARGGGAAWLARDAETKKPLGALGIHERPFWYSQERFLTDLWFFVAEEERGGRIGKDLLELARLEAERRKRMLIVGVMNPGRRRGRIVESIGYLPLGYALRLDKGG